MKVTTCESYIAVQKLGGIINRALPAKRRGWFVVLGPSHAGQVRLPTCVPKSSLDLVPLSAAASPCSCTQNSCIYLIFSPHYIDTTSAHYTKDIRKEHGQ
jgi:hypothetical protein